MESIVEKFNAVDIDRDHELDLLCNEFKSLGSDLLNRTGSDKSTNQFRSRFTAKFGFSPLVVARTWQILEEAQDPLPVGIGLRRAPLLRSRNKPPLRGYLFCLRWTTILKDEKK